MHSLRQRLAREEGFTLIELLIVMVIIGILLAIAVPSYLGFRSRAQDSAAKANLREAIPSAEAYFETNNSYTGLSYTWLKSIDSGLAAQSTSGGAGLLVVGTPGTTYCLESISGSGATFYYAGPGGTIGTTACS
jgi:type IV pilus assembly protein PilA